MIDSGMAEVIDQIHPASWNFAENYFEETMSTC
jgi:hypothetical protein